jgi:uracil-DNA glycosylase
MARKKKTAAAIPSLFDEPATAAAEAPERAAGVPGLPDDLPKSWRKALEPETHKPYWADLMRFVAADRAAHKVYPPEGDVFNA